MKELKKHSFSKVFDLQNSSRTNFYKNILFPKAKKETWSSSITTLPEVIDKKEFPNFYESFKNLDLDIIGTMCIPPENLDPEIYFSEIQKLNNELQLNELSMGMSSDYLYAIKYKSTFLRIGTSIFGKRT